MYDVYKSVGLEPCCPWSWCLEWSTSQVNSYPRTRGFTAIGTGGDDFVQAMVYAVESVVQRPVPQVSLFFYFSYSFRVCIGMYGFYALMFVQISVSWEIVKQIMCVCEYWAHCCDCLSQLSHSFQDLIVNFALLLLHCPWVNSCCFPSVKW